MMKNNFNLPLTVLETGIYDNKHQHVATTTQSQDKAMALAVNSHDDLVEALKESNNYLMGYKDNEWIGFKVEANKKLLAKIEDKS